MFLKSLVKIKNIQTYKIIKICYILFLFFTFIYVNFKVNLILNNNNNFYNKYQTLSLLVPSDKCILFSNTLYFISKFRNNSKNIDNKFDIYKLKIKNKSYFVFYYMFEYYKNYSYIFEEHGLLKKYNFCDNNIIISDSLDLENLNTIKNKKLLNKYQKIFYFKEKKKFFNKDIIYNNYIYMKNLFNEDFNFMSETFNYPENKDLILSKFKNYEFNLENLWLIKPKDNCAGRGIFFFKSLKNITIDNYIITKYITYPHLINNKKYDLRIYVLISGLKPLRIYINKEGLVRFASEKYSLNEKSFQNEFIHLTNTDINKKHRNYIYPQNSEDENSNIWNLHTYKKYLYSKKFNFYLIWDKIKDIIIKTIISLHNNLIKKDEQLNLNDRNFYYLLGFDILITDKLKPILLEVNYPPSLESYNIIDKSIKTNIFIDILNIIGITPFSHNVWSKPLFKEYKFKNNIEEAYNYGLCELTRPRGNFELIFPIKENIKKYQKFFIKNNEENIIFWRNILEISRINLK